MPKSSNQQVNAIFLRKLNIIMKTQESLQYRGYSNCRLCKKINGSTEYTLTKDGVTFNFLEGLIHYYKDHMVQPSDEFYDFIMNY
jgi:hypothetical protein